MSNSPWQALATAELNKRSKSKTKAHKLAGKATKPPKNRYYGQVNAKEKV